MIPATQREALSVLAELCERSDDIRLGQLLAMLGFLGEDQTDKTLWDIEDEQLLAVFKLHRQQLLDRSPAALDRPVPLPGVIPPVSDATSQSAGG
jgi:hypothetical protein